MKFSLKPAINSWPLARVVQDCLFVPVGVWGWGRAAAQKGSVEICQVLLQLLSGSVEADPVPEFSKFAGILSAALSQRHLSGFEIAQLEFYHLY